MDTENYQLYFNNLFTGIDILDIKSYIYLKTTGTQKKARGSMIIGLLPKMKSWLE